ncbi:MAG: VIT domain-containing protein, partial [Planctomycetota bacterium]
MIRRFTPVIPCLFALLLVAAAPASAGESGGEKAKPAKKKEDVSKDVTQGALKVERPDGTYVECPLKHTAVKASISGFIARVNVTQTFVNPSKKKIEAIYVFPLPHKSAVDSMNMLIGERKIVGVIKKRSVAELIYQQAVAAGQTAAVLHQERPNIFTQKVGNIPPGGTVKIQISYVDVLEYDMGEYTFHFPMVVGPRYNPAGWSDGVGAVPAGKGGASGQPVEVGYLKPGQRNGHDISLSLELDAGVPIQNFKSVNHKVEMDQTGESTAKCAIAKGDTIPNKDFELRYAVVGKKPEMAVLAHQDSGRDGYFMLMVQPSEDKKLLEAPPREITFLVDVSGSMSGAPTAQVKLALKHFLKQVSTRDRIQLITFAGTPYNVFPKPQPATAENIKKLADYSRNYRSGGGTERRKAIKAALNDELKGDMVRIVVMLSDGYIGNEKQIIEEVGKRCGDKIRFWCLGVGSSVNRFLIDGVAKQGGGMSKVLSINEKEEEVKNLVGKIMYRIQRAQLAGINIDWGRLNVYETYPARVPELWAGRPVIVHGRYTGGGEARIRISGEAEGRPVSWPLNVTLPVKESANDVLSTVWARKKIESLMDQVWVDGSPEMIEEVTEIALEHKLMSQYTSFVAVDTESGPGDGEPVEPPVRMPV